MRLTQFVATSAMVLLVAGCNNFTGVDSATPNVIVVAGVWEGTAVTTTCVPAKGTDEDFCSKMAVSEEFSFQLYMLQEGDRLNGELFYAGLSVMVGGVVTQDEFVRLAGSSSSAVNGGVFNIVMRSWNTSVVGRGVAGSRISGTWITEATVQGEESVARAEHNIVAATRTQ
jgi:hypothetical protein